MTLWRELPSEVYLAVTQKLESEKRVYGPRTPSRVYTKLAQAKLFLSCHKDRPQKLYKGTVTWEEVEL